MRILIADDNVALAESIASVLRARGAQPVVVGDGASALAVARQQAMDVALVDLKLPQISGLDVLTELGKDGPPPRLLAMTGYGSPGRIAAVEALGVAKVFRKPFDLGDLLETLGLAGAELRPHAGLAKARLAVLAHPDRAIDLDGEGCEIDRFTDPEKLREAVSDLQYDAVLVLGGCEDEPELIEDLKLLDPDVAVISHDRAGPLAEAVERTATRRQLTLRLHTVEKMLRSLPVAALLVDGTPPGALLWNPALESVLGWRPGELREVRLEQLDPSGRDGPLAGLVGEVRRTHGPVSQRMPLRVRGGTARLFKVDGAPTMAYESAVVLAITQGGGHTSQALALQGIGSMAAGVAHEMRNALAGIGNSLSVMKSRVDPGSPGAELLARVLERVARAREVMEDLLAFARPLELRLKAVPAILVLRAAADQVREGAPVGFQVEVDVPDPSLRILVDPDRLHQALINLGNNAVQSIAGPGHLRMSCVREPDHVAILVEDDGPGVPPGVRDRLFQPFLTTRPQGSGLGLANVRKVVEAHGGDIELLPVGPGARFLIHIPPRPVA